MDSFAQIIIPYGLWGLYGAIKHSYYQEQKKSNVQIATYQNVRNY